MSVHINRSGTEKQVQFDETMIQHMQKCTMGGQRIFVMQENGKGKTCHNKSNLRH